jgi:hypothetical protein
MSRANPDFPTPQAALEFRRRVEQEAYYGACPSRMVTKRERQEFRERIRISLTLECGHGETRDFVAARRISHGRMNVNMTKAEDAAADYERREFVRCLACGPGAR